MVTGGIGSMDSYTKAILDASLQEGLTAIDANLIDQSLLNNCRDVEYYHALRKHRPNFYVDGTEDYIEKASLITGQITRLRYHIFVWDSLPSMLHQTALSVGLHLCQASCKLEWSSKNRFRRRYRKHVAV